ncbi:hypothetical protein THF5H11_10757 [Vibrio jasicida]|nr:hypothetical protein THF5H11_10757 [Vibrio jasicida]
MIDLKLTPLASCYKMNKCECRSQVWRTKFEKSGRREASFKASRPCK